MIHCAEENSGLSFQEVKDIHFESLTFFNCSPLRNSTSRKYSNYDSDCYKMYQTRVALYFYICSNVKMMKVNVSHSPNAIGVLMYNVDGTNIFRNSTFEYNQLSEGEKEIPGGGGFYIEFTYCIPSSGENCTCPYQNYTDMPSVITQHNSNSSYTFENCSFSNNKASSVGQRSSKNNNDYIIPNKQTHVAFGRGGGLSVFFKGTARGNSFNISNCKFRQNHALWGGGLLTSFMDASLNNSVLIEDTVFHNNSCLLKNHHRLLGTGGGGMRLGHYVFNTQSFDIENGNKVYIRHCTYTGNHALSGGGLSVSPTLQLYKTYHQLLKVDISNSLFEKNTARIGAALEVTLAPFTISGGPPRVYVGDCEFRKHKLYHKNESAVETGVGTVYSNGAMLRFVGKAVFKENNGSALAVVGERVSFENCTALFVENSGRTGGAITLLGVTYILVNDNTRMNFVRNRAEVYGGAISSKYVGRDYVITNPNCFVRHHDSFLNPSHWKAEFYFEDNRGSLYENDSIHTTSKSPCAWPGWGGIQNIMCRNNWIYCRNNETQNCTSEIRTNAGSIRFDMVRDVAGNVSSTQSISHDTRTVSNILKSQNHSLDYKIPIQAIPGKIIQLPFDVRDDYGHNVTTTTVFAVRTVHTSVSQIDPHFVYTAGGYIKLNGISNHSVEVHLDTLSERTWHIELQVELLECPPGFVPSDDPPIHNSTCMCNPKNYQKQLRCDQSEFTSLLRNGYWMGENP